MRKKRTKKTIRAIVMDRVATLGVSTEGKLSVRERKPSFRDVARTVSSADPMDRHNAYMEFIKEVGDNASEDTKRKVRKVLGL